MIYLTVPLIPPSANHYRGYNRRTGKYYVRRPAMEFRWAVASLLGGQKMPLPGGYRVEIIVYLPKGKRGDVDNFCKVTLDALQYAGAIRNDSMVRRVEAEVRRDWSNPRTEITISA